jgi:hypothetical protein
VLDYNPETGEFTWKVRTSNRARMDGPAGSLHRPTGYWFISVDGRMYKGHRLAFLHMTGAWPSDQIDHINGERADNRWQNLREADARINQQNLRAARSNSESGLLGVYKNDKKEKPWRACIKVDGKWRQIGNFRTTEEAHAAYLAAKRQHHEGCTI